MPGDLNDIILCFFLLKKKDWLWWVLDVTVMISIAEKPLILYKRIKYLNVRSPTVKQDIEYA